MTKTSYEQKRDENVKHVQEVFKSLGIPILAQSIREVISKKEKGRGNSESDNPESDIEYDPSSDVDKQPDTDDDYDDDLNNEVNTEVRCITRPTNKFMVYLFQTYSSLYLIMLLDTSLFITKMHVSLGR